MRSGDNPFPPLRIGGLSLRNNLIAAPMAGLSSLPYRLLAMEEGVALAISEMVSAEGALRAHARTRRYFTNDERARPFGVQLFGADPEAIARAIQALEGEAIDLIDINMGCPVKKVCRKGAGAALLGTPRRAEAIVAAARSATARPLTVKIRSGWSEEHINCAEIARIAEGAGADAVIIHPRTRQQEFRGRADWGLIGQVKRAVGIPVIGNGDVKGRADALRMIAETGCDGVMIGRAAVGNPWIFSQILSAAPEPSLQARGEAALRHFEMLRELVGERLALLQMRQVLAWYGKGIAGVRAFLRDAYQAKDTAALRDAMTRFFTDPLPSLPAEVLVAGGERGG